MKEKGAGKKKNKEQPPEPEALNMDGIFKCSSCSKIRPEEIRSWTKHEKCVLCTGELSSDKPPETIICPFNKEHKVPFHAQDRENNLYYCKACNEWIRVKRKDGGKTNGSERKI
jgi:hypothetical protein